MITEKTIIKLTAWAVVLILGCIITWTVAATTWKVNIERSVDLNSIDIIKLDIEQRKEAKKLELVHDATIETNINVKWMMKYMEEKE